MGYSLDAIKKVKIQKFEFSDSFEMFYINPEPWFEVGGVELLECVQQILIALDSSTKQGYLTHHDLRKFPVLGEILPSFCAMEESCVNGEFTMECYKWLYNLVLLNLYVLLVEILQRSTSVTDEEIEHKIKAFEIDLLTRLDPSIRFGLRKCGVSIKENVEIGFDTEFRKVGEVSNEIVSSQIAVTTKTYIQIPRLEKYILSRVDEQSNKLEKIQKVGEFNYAKVEMSIQKSINRLRSLKFGGYDGNMKILTECLQQIKGVSYAEREDHTVFSLPRSSIQPYIKVGGDFSLKELLTVSSKIATPMFEKEGKIIQNLLQEIQAKGFTTANGMDRLKEEIYLFLAENTVFENLNVLSDQVLPFTTDDELASNTPSLKIEKSLRRSYLHLPEKVSVTTKRVYTVTAHLTPADLSMLSDFDVFKEELSIVNGSFVTLGKPFKYEDRCVHFRDTMLLAPGGSKSLDSIGKLYKKGYQKIKVSQEDLENMQLFLDRDREGFIEYAIRDAVISLVHACWMEDFNFPLGGLGIPISLSSIGRKYVKSIWTENKYEGYQISQKYLLGDVSKTMTPKGLNAVKDIGFVLPYYIANYKGGRNECFMYGVDKDVSTIWYDYDLTSAYTTVLSMAGHPDYSNCVRLSEDELKKLSQEEILYSYLIIAADFEFPPSTKYPSIPCYVDENCTVYPLTGSCVLTGAEYLLAKRQGCKFQFDVIHYTPFLTSDYKDFKPFARVINLVQEQRREHPKGSISNLMYKEIGNSIYGSVVRGLGDKRKFDIKSKGMIRMVGDDLTNPLIAS